MDLASLGEFYDDYPRIEAAFQAVLDESLGPRGPEFLYGIVSKLGLPPGANVVTLAAARDNIRSSWRNSSAL
jgi:hypothetical protein